MSLNYSASNPFFFQFFYSTFLGGGGVGGISYLSFSNIEEMKIGDYTFSQLIVSLPKDRINENSFKYLIKIQALDEQV